MSICFGVLRVPFFVCNKGVKADTWQFLGRHFVFIAARQEDADMRHFI